MPKRKCVVLSVKAKNDLLDDLERGVPVSECVAKYGIAKQTISDIKKKKEQIRAYAKEAKRGASISDPSLSKKRFKVGHYGAVEEATVRWFRQQESVGITIRSFELKNAALRLATQMGVKGFSASDGWLHRFRRRHGLFPKRAYGESGSATTQDIDPFRHDLNKLISDEGLLWSQVYNMDETGLFWRALPQDTHVMGMATKAKGRKLDKSRISVLCGANADGSHRLKPVVVGKSARPRCLKDCLNKLSCHYYNSKNAWFTCFIFEDCFFKHIVPEIIAYQRDVLKISYDRIRAVVLLDNAPAHPSKEKLVAHNGKIRVMFLPPNTTALIQPMDQGVIHAVKLGYRRLFLSEVMVVEESVRDEEEETDTRGVQTLENLRTYNLKQAISNFGEAWKALKATTLANAWKRLLFDVDVPVVDFDGFEVADFQKMFTSGGENVGEEEVREWLEKDEGDPGHHILTESEIIDSVTKVESDNDGSDDDDEQTSFSIKLTTARSYCDALIQLIDIRSKDFSHDAYYNLRAVRREIIELQHASGKQTKISSFFRSRTPTPTPEPQPSTSRVSAPLPLSDSE